MLQTAVKRLNQQMIPIAMPWCCRKQAVKGLLLHTKMYLQITPETFRNERTTRVWFREVYKFKILKRDSVHGGMCLSKSAGAATTRRVELVEFDVVFCCRCAWNPTRCFYHGLELAHKLARRCVCCCCVFLCVEQNHDAYGFVNTGNDPRLTWKWSGSGEFESTLSMIVTAGPSAEAPKLLQRDFSLRRNLSNNALTLMSRFTLFVSSDAVVKNCCERCKIRDLSSTMHNCSFWNRWVEPQERLAIYLKAL